MVQHQRCRCVLCVGGAVHYSVTAYHAFGSLSCFGHWLRVSCRLVFLVLWLLLRGDTRLDERLATRAFQVMTVTPVLGSVQSHAGMFVFLILWLLLRSNNYQT